MKLVREDVVAFIGIFILYIVIAILGTNKSSMTILPNILIVFMGIVCAFGTLMCLFVIKRYETKKVPVRGQHSLFKFFFYREVAILVYKNNIDAWMFNYGDGDIEKLKKVEYIEIIFYTDRKGKDAGYRINPWKYVDEPVCPRCEGYGTMVSRPARAMGYTIGPDEDKNILDEQLVPCSCRRNNE